MLIVEESAVPVILELSIGSGPESNEKKRRISWGNETI